MHCACVLAAHSERRELFCVLRLPGLLHRTEPRGWTVQLPLEEAPPQHTAEQTGDWLYRGPSQARSLGLLCFSASFAILHFARLFAPIFSCCRLRIWDCDRVHLHSRLTGGRRDGGRRGAGAGSRRSLLAWQRALQLLRR